MSCVEMFSIIPDGDVNQMDILQNYEGSVVFHCPQTNQSSHIFQYQWCLQGVRYFWFYVEESVVEKTLIVTALKLFGRMQMLKFVHINAILALEPPIL